MTVLDWAIVAFTLALALWGYRQGLIVGALTLAGFALGAFAGSRLGPLVLCAGLGLALRAALRGARGAAGRRRWRRSRSRASRSGCASG